MKTIWKYKLEPNDYNEIDMPDGAEILTVQTQKRITITDVYLWALVNPENPKKARRFRTFGTGQNINVDDHQWSINHKYIGTYQLYGGDIVGHVFEVIGL